MKLLISSLLAAAALALALVMLSTGRGASSAPAIDSRPEASSASVGQAELAELEVLDQGRVQSPLEPAVGSKEQEAEEIAPEAIVREPDAMELDGSADGLTLQFEDAEGRGIPGATVDVNWRAGFGDTRNEFGVTDARGRLVTNVELVVQLQAVELRREGERQALIDRSEGFFVDPAQPGLVRFRTPVIREVLVRVLDAEGHPVPDAVVDFDEEMTLEMETGVHRMGVLRNYDPMPVDSKGEVRASLQETAYEITATSDRQAFRAERVVVLSVLPPGPAQIELVLKPNPPHSAPRAPLRRKAPSAPPPEYRVMVVDAYSRSPVERALLSFQKSPPFRSGGSSGKTGPDGVAVVRGLGQRYLVANARGYGWSATPKKNLQRQELTVLELEPTQSIRGRAVTSDGAPVPGSAYLYAPWERLGVLDAPGDDRFCPQAVQTVGTGEPGRFRFSKVTSAEHRIRFVPDDSARAPVSVVARGGDEDAVILVEGLPTDLARVEGVVVDAISGETVEGMKVLFSRSDSRDGRIALSDSEGRYVIAGLGPGEYVVKLQTPGESKFAGKHAFTSVTTELVAGDNRLNIRVPPARELRLLIRGGTPSGPIARARVYAFDAEGRAIEFQDSRGYSSGPRKTTTWQGRVDLVGLPAQHVELRIWAVGVDKEEPPTFRHEIDLTEPMSGIVELRF